MEHPPRVYRSQIRHHVYDTFEEGPHRPIIGINRWPPPSVLACRCIRMGYKREKKLFLTSREEEKGKTILPIALLSRIS